MRTNAEAVARELWAEVDSIVPPYPAGIVAVSQPIEGTAFFPGGLGLWREGRGSSSEFPTGQIMVVGQDFNTVGTYNRARTLKSEVDISQTWQNMRRVFGLFDIRVECCFFTNVYMGLRAAGPETGRFPGARDPAFVDRCVAFFGRQVTVARPRLIITLGLEPIRVLARCMLGIKAPSTLSACNRIYKPVL